MEIDALLILVLAVLVSQFDKAGAWVILSGLLRYAFVAAGAYWQWLQAPLMPSRRRQTICVVQILALTIALLPAVEPPVSTMLAAAALGSLTCSFLVDTVWLWRRAQ
jgi:phosphatidylglycerophosphate synthase